jgi:uncharacterized phage protein gp47/JayE
MGLTLDNLSAEQQLFADALKEAGMPVAEEELREELQQLANEANLSIANPSQYSAFWSFCKEAVISPAEFLTAFLIKHAMPNLYVKTASGEMLDLIAWSYNMSRKSAVKMRGELTFTRNTAEQAVLIPAGTTVRTIAINGNIYRVMTLAPAVMETGQTTIRVLCEAEAAGSDYNLGVAYYSIMDSDVPGISAVSNEADYLITPGVNEESDAELRLRLRNHFSAVSDWHTDAKYKAMIAERTGFSIDHIFFDHNIPRGPGSADAYILFDYGVVPDATLAAVNEYVNSDGNHGHGDDLQVKAIPESFHDVAASIEFIQGSTTAEKTELLEQIKEFIRCAFRENADYSDYVSQTWPFARFSFSKLSGELHNYFKQIKAITWAQEDIISSLDVPRLQTLSITEDA